MERRRKELRYKSKETSKKGNKREELERNNDKRAEGRNEKNKR